MPVVRVGKTDKIAPTSPHIDFPPREDDLFEIYDVDEEEFKKELIQTKKIWSNDNECRIEIEKDEANGTITKTWCFEWEKLWVVVNDYKELEELGL